jgi:hypothetical protein
VHAFCCHVPPGVGEYQGRPLSYGVTALVDHISFKLGNKLADARACYLTNMTPTCLKRFSLLRHVGVMFVTFSGHVDEEMVRDICKSFFLGGCSCHCGGSNAPLKVILAALKGFKQKNEN